MLVWFCVGVLLVSDAYLAAKSPHNKHALKAGQKIVHFVRHAEGHHNVAAVTGIPNFSSESLSDAQLTGNGMEQCRHLNQLSREYVSNAELIIVSPMHRTLQTATYSFPQLINLIPWVAHESVREQSGLYPSDRRQPIDEHSVTYPYVNFTLIKHNIDPIFSLYPTSREPLNPSIISRCYDFLDFLSTREEKEVILVSHSEYLYQLLNEVIGGVDPTVFGRPFYNAELRTKVLNFTPHKPNTAPSPPPLAADTVVEHTGVIPGQHTTGEEQETVEIKSDGLPAEAVSPVEFAKEALSKRSIAIEAPPRIKKKQA